MASPRFFLLLGFWTVNSLSWSYVNGQMQGCYGSTTKFRCSFIGPLTQDDLVVSGHVVATFQVQNFSECFAKCRTDCACRSFNLPKSGRGECQVNDADNTTTVLKPRPGWRYHHIETRIIRKSSETCLKKYENGCCSSNPCKNGANCSEHDGNGKPAFHCACLEGFIGQRCERKIRSCLDYLWHNKNQSSGYYELWTDDGSKFRAFCDMFPKAQEAWTLVMSHSLGRKNEFASQPLFKDYSRNTGHPEGEAYRLPLASMKSVARRACDNGSAEWRVTCDYSLKNRSLTNSDLVIGRFEVLDILDFRTIAPVGYYPFTNVTTNQDKSGFNNHASLSYVSYEDGPLGIKRGSVRMSSKTDTESSYIEGRSEKLNPRFGLTIVMQIYLNVSRQHNSVDGNQQVHKQPGYQWTFVVSPSGWKTYWTRLPKPDGDVSGHLRVRNLKHNTWYYVAVTYNRETGRQTAFVNGKLLNNGRIEKEKLNVKEDLGLSIDLKSRDDYLVHDGRVACLRIYNTSLTDDDVKRMTKDWTCPEEPEPVFKSVDYISVRGKRCSNCIVWATQTEKESFTINAYRGDRNKVCNFNSGSTVPDENIFGVYRAMDSATHSCTASSNSRTQYWFGGRL